MLYGGFILVQSGAVFTFIYLAGVLGERVQYDLRKMLFNHLQDLSLSYYAQNAVGRLIARVTSDTGRVADLLTWGVVDTTWAVMNIITSLTFMAIINWKLALIVFTVIPVMLVIAVQFRKKILVEYRTSRRTNSKITGAFNENFQGVRVVKALLREDENTREFQGLTTQMYKASYRAAWLSALFLPTVQIIAALALGFIVGYGGTQITNRSDDHRRHPGLRLVPDLHDVADPGPGKGVRRDAALHRVGGEDLQAGGYPARGPRQTRRPRRRP
jgi:ATP-binding cassette, subfamily B, bacterial